MKHGPIALIDGTCRVAIALQDRFMTNTARWNR